MGTSVEQEIIENAEKQLNVKFDNDYKEFIGCFGGSYIGFPLYAFNNCKMLSDETIVDLTLNFRDAYLLENKFPIIQESYVISVDGNGDPLVITPDGKVVIYYHDNNEQKVLADSFYVFLKSMMIDLGINRL